MRWQEQLERDPATAPELRRQLERQRLDREEVLRDPRNRKCWICDGPQHLNGACPYGFGAR